MNNLYNTHHSKSEKNHVRVLWMNSGKKTENKWIFPSIYHIVDAIELSFVPLLGQHMPLLLRREYLKSKSLKN